MKSSTLKKKSSDFIVVIVLPAFNEELTIVGTIEAFHSTLPSAEIWIINNSSTDSTESLARSTLSRLGCAGGVLNESRKGKGNAVRRAFLELNADLYVLADADLTYPADRVCDLMAPVINGCADMVVGDRHSAGHYAAENKRVFHGFGNRLVRDLVNRMFGANLADIMSGYRVFSRRFVKTYPILVEGFEIETDITLHALDKRFRIVEIPVEYIDRPQGSISKLNTYTDGLKVLFTIVQIFRYYRPLMFFGIFGLIFLLFGLLASYPVLYDWFYYGYIYHVPLAILSAGLEIVALLAFGIGLILDSIRHQNMMEFERILITET